MVATDGTKKVASMFVDEYRYYGNNEKIRQNELEKAENFFQNWFDELSELIAEYKHQNPGLLPE